MKAVISNRIYMNCSAEYREFLSKELTYVIPSYNPNNPPQVIKNMARVRKDIVSIPVGRVDLIPANYEVVDKRLYVLEDFPEHNFILRDSQKVVYDDIQDNAIINAWVSWGKTYTALAIAGKLAQKTLVVTHTLFLRDQWIKDVKEVFGINAGIIGSGKFNIDSPIVVGNTQTLYSNIPKIQKEFGTVILDEMHHVSAPSFSRIIDTSYARYKIGLSGTIERKDGKHVVFRDYFGNNVYQPPKENYMEPSIDLIPTQIRFMDGARTPWAHRVTDLTTNPDYVHLIAMVAAAYAAKGHKVLLLGVRTAFLKHVAELIGENAICITGETQNREELLGLVRSGKRNVICGAQSIFSEGISENSLSCLIMGTPVNNEPLLTQLIGRVIREDEGKLQPKIVDFQLMGNTAKRQAFARIGYYMRMGYRINKL